MSEKDVFSKFKAKRPATVLKDLADAKPTVTLILAGGASIAGILIKVDRAESEDCAWLATVTSDGVETGDAASVLLHNVIAVTVHRASKHASLLSGGDVARNPGEPATGKLEVSRVFAELSETIAKKYGPKLKHSLDLNELKAEQLANAKDMAKNLMQALEAICTDKIGKSAVQALKTITLKSGEALGVTRKGDSIEVAANLEKALPTKLEEKLKSELEANL